MLSPLSVFETWVTTVCFSFRNLFCDFMLLLEIMKNIIRSVSMVQPDFLIACLIMYIHCVIRYIIHQ